MKTNIFFNVFGFFAAFLLLGCSNQTPSSLAKYNIGLIWDYPHRFAGAEGNVLFARADSLKYERDYDNAAMAFSKLLDQGMESDPDKWYAMNQLAYLCLKTHKDEAARNLIFKLKQAIDVVDADKVPFELADLQYNMGLLYYHGFQPDSALVFLNSACSAYKKNYPRGHFKFAQCLNTIGMVYFEMTATPNLAISYIEDAFKMFQKMPNQLRIENELAMSMQYLIRYAYQDSKKHAENAVQFGEEAPWTDTILLCVSLGKLAKVLKVTDTIENSLAKYERALALIGQDHPVQREELCVDLIYHSIYKIALSKGTPAYDAVFHLYDSIFFYNIKKFEKEINAGHGSDRHSSLFYLYGLYYHVVGDTKKAIKYGRMFWEKNQQHPQFVFFKLDKTIDFLAQSYIKTGSKQDSALYFAKKALLLGSEYFFKGESLTVRELLQPHIYSKIFNPYVYYGLIGKILLYKYKRLGDPQLLHVASDIFQLADNLLFYGISSQGETETMALEKDKADIIYPTAIEISTILYNKTKKKQYLDSAFKYFERQKSYILYRNAFAEANDPKLNLAIDSIRYLHSVLAAAEWEEKNGNSGSAVNTTAYKMALNALYDRIKKEFPEYARQRIAQAIPSVEAVQNILQREQELISYHLNTNGFYIFYINKDTAFIKMDTAIFKLESAARRFRDLTAHMPNTADVDQFKTFVENGQTLYERLIQPTIHRGNKKALIVIADRFLHTIPFEALPVDRPLDISRANYAALNYVADSKTIVYSPSWKLYQSNCEKNSGVPTKPSIAFYTTGTIDPTGSQQKAIETGYGKQSVAKRIGANCSKKRFISEIDKFDVFHFCLHAKSNPMDEQDNKMYFGEKDGKRTDALVGLEVAYKHASAKLVVFSACETGLGKNTGEGCLSLSRAFIQSGIPNVVASLWEIEENPTSDILTNFYQVLPHEPSVSLALHRAKKAFLKKQKAGTAQFVHPYYWAGLVPYF